MKTVLKQLLPPILLPPAQTLLRFLRKGSTSITPDAIKSLSLKASFDKRNEHINPDEIALRDDIILKLHPESREPIEFFCYRSPAMVEEMDSFIRLTKSKRNLLDIGALHGAFSLAFVAGSLSRKAVAVDASPVAFARLLYNIHKNKFSNITPVECALSDRAGVLEMHYEWEHAVAAGTGKTRDRELLITKRTGDDLCEGLQFKPDAIKIDVEGHEVKVLRGLQKVLQSARPMIFLELHPSRISEEQDKIDDVLQMLAGLRYRTISTGGIAISAHEVTTSNQDQRLVFIPDDTA